MDVRVELRALWFNFFTHIFSPLFPKRGLEETMCAVEIIRGWRCSREREGSEEDANACERDV